MIRNTHLFNKSQKNFVKIQKFFSNNYYSSQFWIDPFRSPKRMFNTIQTNQEREIDLSFLEDPSVEAMTKLMKFYGKKKELKTMIEIYKEMIKQKKEINEDTIEILFYYLGTKIKGNEKEFKKLYVDIPENKKRNFSEKLNNQLIFIFHRVNDYEKIIEKFDEMVLKKQHKTERTYLILLLDFIEKNDDTQLKKLEEELLNEINHLRLKNENENENISKQMDELIKMLNKMIKYYCDGNSIKSVLEIENKMKEQQIKFTDEYYRIKLVYYSKMQQVKKVEEIYHELLGRTIEKIKNNTEEVKPRAKEGEFGIELITCFINSFGQVGDFKKIDDILLYMKYFQIKPNLTTLNTLIHFYSKSNLWENIYSLLNSTISSPSPSPSSPSSPTSSLPSASAKEILESQIKVDSPETPLNLGIKEENDESEKNNKFHENYKKKEKINEIINYLLEKKANKTNNNEQGIEVNKGENEKKVKLENEENLTIFEKIKREKGGLEGWTKGEENQGKIQIKDVDSEEEANISTITILIDNLGKSKQFPLIVEFYNKLKQLKLNEINGESQHKIEFDIMFYATIINHYGKAKYFQKIPYLIEDMILFNILPNIHIYNSLIHSFSSFIASLPFIPSHSLHAGICNDYFLKILLIFDKLWENFIYFHPPPDHLTFPPLIFLPLSSSSSSNHFPDSYTSSSSFSFSHTPSFFPDSYPLPVDSFLSTNPPISTAIPPLPLSKNQTQPKSTYHFTQHASEDVQNHWNNYGKAQGLFKQDGKSELFSKGWKSLYFEEKEKEKKSKVQADISTFNTIIRILIKLNKFYLLNHILYKLSFSIHYPLYLSTSTLYYPNHSLPLSFQSPPSPLSISSSSISSPSINGNTREISEGEDEYEEIRKSHSMQLDIRTYGALILFYFKKLKYLKLREKYSSTLFDNIPATASNFESEKKYAINNEGEDKKPHKFKNKKRKVEEQEEFIELKELHELYEIYENNIKNKEQINAKKEIELHPEVEKIFSMNSVFEIIEEFKAKKLKGNIYIFNLILSSLSTLSLSEEMEAVYLFMKNHEEIRPDFQSLTPLVECFAKLNKIDKMEHYLSLLEESGYSPSYLTCNYIISAYSSTNSPEYAKKIGKFKNYKQKYHNKHIKYS